MNVARSEHLIESLEADPAKLPAFYIELENIIAWCVDEIFRLAKTDGDAVRKIGSVGPD